MTDMNLELDFGMLRARQRGIGAKSETDERKRWGGEGEWQKGKMKEVTRERRVTKVEKHVCKMLFIPWGDTEEDVSDKRLFFTAFCVLNQSSWLTVCHLFVLVQFLLWGKEKVAAAAGKDSHSPSWMMSHCSPPTRKNTTMLTFHNCPLSAQQLAIADKFTEGRRVWYACRFLASEELQEFKLLSL